MTPREAAEKISEIVYSHTDRPLFKSAEDAVVVVIEECLRDSQAKLAAAEKLVAEWRYRNTWYGHNAYGDCADELEAAIGKGWGR